MQADHWHLIVKTAKQNVYCDMASSFRLHSELIDDAVTYIGVFLCIGYIFGCLHSRVLYHFCTLYCGWLFTL